MVPRRSGERSSSRWRSPWPSRVRAWQTSRAEGAPIYWGAYIDGGTYGYDDAPYDARSIDAFESHAGKRVSIVHWGQPWYWGSHGGYQPFRRDLAARVRARGSIPMINWNSWDLDKGGSLDQPDFQLLDIINGAHDAYIRQWARDAKAWGFPLFVRFDHEMNGDWFPWSERENGNGPGQYARMWRHVVDIFNQEGATNVTWVWAPNRLYADAIPLDSLYPGDRYVDWTGISGYNWGTNPAEPGNTGSRSPRCSGHLRRADGAGAVQADHDRGDGLDRGRGLEGRLDHRRPAGPAARELAPGQGRAVVQLEHQVSNGTMDWVIESSAAARAAFAAGISSPYYAANTFGGLPALTKVTPIGEAPAGPGAGGAPGSGSPGAGGARRSAPDPLPGRAAPLPPGAARVPAPGLARRSAAARPGALLDPRPRGHGRSDRRPARRERGGRTAARRDPELGPPAALRARGGAAHGPGGGGDVGEGPPGGDPALVHPPPRRAP